jgi:hypothetical protein
MNTERARPQRARPLFLGEVDTEIAFLVLSSA